MKFTVAIPLVASIVSFVLTILALLAGSHKGFMEDYHVVMVNTSTLGQNFLANLADGSSSGLFSSIEASATAVIGSVESEAASILNDIGNDVADKLSKELGIEQFYSFHVLDLCQGDYAPNATASGAWLNISSVLTTGAASMDMSDLLNKQLSLGPFNVSLSDLGFTQKLEQKLSKLPTVFEALAALYIVSTIFTGLSILGAAAGFFLIPQKGRKVLVANLGLALTAALVLFIGSLLYTVGATEMVKKIREENADDIGLEVTVGSKFQGLTWAAFALMVVATGYWTWELIAAIRARRRNQRTRGKVEKHSMDSSWDRRNYR
ncbi:hypothetical protein M406DRAFT_297234 [Cryphonectria parasitica EP155]|uniref:SUR7 protein n=1 Tax=Cryphonectria parasitica (strain ATCC 38755 / EP155) TaxID=660469 RepID=A0A9P4XPC8_CRYP1|nr:uncharacterized protein M406DRAFT_297234 [Cryphonectria parasitica EP155]KAF3759909.1 hypothetical protein M406DRAFT_297234 [Cryphonectria parasitica EP155]